MGPGGDLSVNPPIRNPWPKRIVVGVILSFAAFFLWLGAYPDNTDPRNIYYVLWKHGLNSNMNLDDALVAMLRDSGRERQVQGLTEDQLKARFGYIRTLGKVTTYYQACYFTPGTFTEGDARRAEIAAKSKDAFFLRDSPWMVVMKDGKAVDLILCKGY